MQDALGLWQCSRMALKGCFKSLRITQIKTSKITMFLEQKYYRKYDVNNQQALRAGEQMFQNVHQCVAMFTNVWQYSSTMDPDNFSALRAKTIKEITKRHEFDNVLE